MSTCITSISSPTMIKSSSFSYSFSLLSTLSESGSESESKSDSCSSDVAIPGHVYYVSTPIGNLQDITKRSIDILSNCDIICAEDTRHTIRLLRALNIPHKKIIAHHQYNTNDLIPKIINLVSNEMNSIAVVSDAGTPGISDPGTELAHALAIEKIPIHPIPGPCAIAAALSISGYNTSPFTFYGFIDVKGKLRKKKFKDISNTLHTSVLYESPHRIINTLNDMITYNMGNRPCLLCREMTKLHEEQIRGSVKHCLKILQNRDWTNKPPFDDLSEEIEDDIEENYDQDEVYTEGKDERNNLKIKKKPKLKGLEKKRVTIKGEFTIVLGPYQGDTDKNENENVNDSTSTITSNNSSNSINTSDSDMVKALTMLENLKNKGLRRSEAVNQVIEILGISKKKVYKVALLFDSW